MRRSRIIDAVGASGKGDPLIPDISELGKSNAIIGADLRENMLFTNSARNQLIILTAEIQKKILFHLVSPLII